MLMTAHSTFAQSKNKAARQTDTAGNGTQDRAYWASLLYKITYPVVHNMAEGTLKKNLPMEEGPGYYLVSAKVSYLEAVGRTMAGLAPWLALPPDNTPEGKMRKQLTEELLKGLKNAVDPAHPDYLNFRTEYQPLVDAAYLAQAFLHAPGQLWQPLDSLTKKRFIEEFKALRTRRPHYNNWLLFAAITETFLLKIGEDYDPARIDHALKKINEWYVGDGCYSDGPHFSLDYYNSFVIHPMLYDVLQVLVEKKMAKQEELDKVFQRMERYGELQERMISPEGYYPPTGRSITYRVGAFQVLSKLSLLKKLPASITPAQVRCALTKVMHNQFEQPGTFDGNGWLQLGFAGHQPDIADPYTSTGSLYICSLGFLALGLPANDAFWTDPPAEWTSKKAWSGKPVKKDMSLERKLEGLF
jgi:hypothetical protein